LNRTPRLEKAFPPPRRVCDSPSLNPLAFPRSCVRPRMPPVRWIPFPLPLSRFAHSPFPPVFMMLANLVFRVRSTLLYHPSFFVPLSSKKKSHSTGTPHPISLCLATVQFSHLQLRVLGVSVNVLVVSFLAISSRFRSSLLEGPLEVVFSRLWSFFLLLFHSIGSPSHSSLRRIANFSSQPARFRLSCSVYEASVLFFPLFSLFSVRVKFFKLLSCQQGQACEPGFSRQTSCQGAPLKSVHYFKALEHVGQFRLPYSSRVFTDCKIVQP